MLPERKSWIDIAKCFGIFFIVLGHCCTAGDYFAYITYSFNSAIFFILSGMTFCTGKSAKGVFKWLFVKSWGKLVLLIISEWKSMFDFHSVF